MIGRKATKILSALHNSCTLLPMSNDISPGKSNQFTFLLTYSITTRSIISLSSSGIGPNNVDDGNFHGDE
jgi:hypothetical protein